MYTLCCDRDEGQGKGKGDRGNLGEEKKNEEKKIQGGKKNRRRIIQNWTWHVLYRSPYSIETTGGKKKKDKRAGRGHRVEVDIILG